MAIRKIAPLKETSISLKVTKAKLAAGRGPSQLEKLQEKLAEHFGKLGCPACMSGINRIIIEDQVARGVR